MSTNPTLELAREFVHYTSKNIFLTGKAGTGKTTFLHSLKETLPKRMAIVAPTGVAAINAGGVTIHSFFQLPFGPYIPEATSGQNKYKFNRERINVLKGLDLLVIDEISMVRADTLDAIDEVLRQYRDRDRPFGGVQLLMIGDLHQLPPVVTQQDWQILRDHYKSAYFFNSKALALKKPVCIELTQIYRQSDPVFVDLLNQVRDNQLSEESIEILNKRFIANFEPDDDEGYITLTTHKDLAHHINASKLKSLTGKNHTFEADHSGDFPAHNYPTEQSLELKVGAQVMFIKNDPSREKQYYNGKIGKVVRMTSDTIFVRSKDSYSEIAVERAEWHNIKYMLNAETKELEEQILGTFTQIPLKLAWAITIHKSQGLTFEKAIIDASQSFTHGQVYVALSRCKSLEGLVLSKRIAKTSIKTDQLVANFSAEVGEHPPDQLQLNLEKQAFQSSLLFDLFDFASLKRPSYHLHKVIQENAAVLNSALVEEHQALNLLLREGLFDVADKFRNQLQRMLQESGGLLEQPELEARIQKACKYFLNKIQEEVVQKISAFVIETDNSALKKATSEALAGLRHALYIKEKCLASSLDGFTAQSYLQTKSNADIDYLSMQKQAVKKGTAPAGQTNGALYVQIKAWRNEKAAEHNVEDYMILTLKSIAELARTRPRNSKELGKIPGIGKVKLRQFGEELLGIILEYTGETQEVTSERKEEDISAFNTLKKKVPTRQVSYEAFLSGQSPKNIALTRKLSLGTVETHLLAYVANGELDVYKLFPATKIDPILDYCRENQSRSGTEVRRALGDHYSYAEIRAALCHLQSNG